MLNGSADHWHLASRQRGFSVVELLVGAALGLFLVGGAVALFVTNMGNSRQMLLEARINQDMRAAADLIARDLRRSGYWANAVSGTVAGTGVATASNAYSGITGTFDVPSGLIEYSFARDTNNTLENNEQFGFRLNNGVIQMKTSGAPTWQDVTDPGAATITNFTITRSETVIPVGDRCIRGCNTVPPPMPSASSAACPNPPALNVRRYDLLIEATAPNNATIRRTLREAVRVRNDQLMGVCP
jgi:prepilin peptidase dependent protein B